MVFVPDSMLSGVPFAALIDGGGHYLIESKLVSIAPSATVYVRSAARDRILAAREHPSILILASPEQPRGFESLAPLLNAPKEAEMIAALYPEHRLLHSTDPQALRLLPLATGYDAIHFGGHALVDEHRPEVSCLFVGTTGRIRAAEIESTRLPRTRLVVLGGCSTGAGKKHRSEGVLSVARAFLATSVPSVLSTVAPIEDRASAHLLVAFHAAYARGTDAVSALRTAQLQMLHSGDPDWTDPVRWAAFEVVGGTWSPIETAREERTRR
jgi:CHAT domain-containing protein